MCKCNNKPVSRVTYSIPTLTYNTDEKASLTVGVKAPIKLVINGVETFYSGGSTIYIPTSIYNELVQGSFPIWRM